MKNENKKQSNKDAYIHSITSIKFTLYFKFLKIHIETIAKAF